MSSKQVRGAAGYRGIQDGGTFAISNASDLLRAGAELDSANGLYVFTRPTRLLLRGRVELPAGFGVLDDASTGTEPGVSLTGETSAGDQLVGDRDGAVWRSANGVNLRNLTIENVNAGADAWCVQTTNRLPDMPSGIPEFRASTIDSVAVRGLRGVLLDGLPPTPVPPLFAGVIGVQVNRLFNRCTATALRIQGAAAGIGIVNVINVALTDGLEVIQLAQVPDGGPIGITDSRFFIGADLPAVVRGIVFEDAATQTAAGNVTVASCLFEVSDPSDVAASDEQAIYDRTALAAVIPGVGNALVSIGNVFAGNSAPTAPRLLTSFP